MIEFEKQVLNNRCLHQLPEISIFCEIFIIWYINNKKYQFKIYYKIYIHEIYVTRTRSDELFK